MPRSALIPRVLCCQKQGVGSASPERGWTRELKTPPEDDEHGDVLFPLQSWTLRFSWRRVEEENRSPSHPHQSVGDQLDEVLLLLTQRPPEPG